MTVWDELVGQPEAVANPVRGQPGGPRRLWPAGVRVPPAATRCWLR